MTRDENGGGLTPPGDWLKHDDEAIGEGVGARFLTGVTLLAAALRIYGLTAQSLWVDEMLTWLAIRPGHGLGFVEQVLDTFQGPLYMAVTWPLVRLADPELMLRLTPMLAGIAAVPVFGALAARWWGRRTGRLAALLFALNPYLVWYSQEGRGYSYLIFFLVVLAAVFTSMVEGRPTLRRAVAFGLLGAAAIWSNLSGLFLLAAMGLSVLIWFRPRSGREWGAWSLAFGLGILLAAPWLLKASGVWAIDRVVPGAGTGPILRGETTFTPLALPYSFFTFFYGNSLGPSLRDLHQPDRMAQVMAWAPVLAAAALPVAAGVLAALWRLPRRRAFLLVWILVPVAILVFLATRNIKPWNPRYVLTILPWVLVLAAHGLARLPSRAGFALTILLTGLTLWSLGNYYWNGRYAKADLRAAARYVTERNEENLAVLAPTITSVYRFYHDSGAEVLSGFGWPQLQSAADADGFCADRLAGRDACWIVLGREWDFDPRAELLPALGRIGRLHLEETHPGVRVYSWSRAARQGDG